MPPGHVHCKSARRVTATGVAPSQATPVPESDRPFRQLLVLRRRLQLCSSLLACVIMQRPSLHHRHRGEHHLLRPPFRVPCASQLLLRERQSLCLPLFVRPHVNRMLCIRSIMLPASSPHPPSTRSARSTFTLLHNRPTPMSPPLAHGFSIARHRLGRGQSKPANPDISGTRCPEAAPSSLISLYSPGRYPRTYER